MNIRNFSIIAHIDHGKSTLAERFLELSRPAERRATGPLFDTMELEQERGVTIKLKPVSFLWRGTWMNLIDTPGHADFAYEVSRALAAVEGALLVVDATQGIQAQTLAHFSVARGLGLTIIPVVNKIDLPNAETEAVAASLCDLVGCNPDAVLRVSAKTGDGVPAVLDAILHRMPAPAEVTTGPARGLIFDAVFDEFRGVIAYVRLMEGTLQAAERLRLLATDVRSDILEVGRFLPSYTEQPALTAGHIGYVVTGLKSLEGVRVGDTLTLDGAAVTALPGYREPQPMVFASLYPQEGGDVNGLRRSLEKLRLNDSSLQFEGERSQALGFGFRCGFLGLFHLEIVQERLRREFGQDLLATVPSVAYRVTLTDGAVRVVRAAQDFPDPTLIAQVEEPWVRLHCLTPPASLGALMQLVTERRGVIETTEVLSGTGPLERITLQCLLPLANVLTDFYDRVKSRSSGFASLYYEFFDFRIADIVRIDILIAGERAEALSTLVVRPDAERTGRAMLAALKAAIPREQFEIRLQAALGGKILAAERIAPLRKDVTAKLYGGDVTRKRKLLEKQKKGKKRMRSMGRVALPAAAYLAVLKKDSHP